MAEVRIDVPNLDCLDESDLREIGKVFGKLERYARLKALAMRRRIDGDTSGAWTLEARCDGIYRQLPPEYRW